MSRGPGQKYLMQILNLIAELPAFFRQAAVTPTRPAGQNEPDHIGRRYGPQGLDPLDAAINEALARVGVLLQISRVYVMRLEARDTLLRTTHEWANFNVSASLPSWPLYDLPSLPPILRKDGLINGQAEELPGDLARILALQEVVSILVCPMWRGEAVIGLVGFDACKKRRLWHPAEVNLGRCLAAMVAQGLEERRLLGDRERLDKARAAMEEALASIDSDRLEETTAGANPLARLAATADPTPSEDTMREVERRLIAQTLARYNGNKSKTAKHLGLSWPTLHRRLKKLDME